VNVAENLAKVRERIVRAGRDPEEVTIVAVTKGFDVSVCREAITAGLRVLGENRVHEALAKMEEVPDAEWHLIGHLQTNKGRVAAGRFALIQSVDSIRLCEDLARGKIIDLDKGNVRTELGRSIAEFDALWALTKRNVSQSSRGTAGPGAMVMSYLETSYGGQRAVARMVSSGALDRHPTLKILVSEGGASWVPFLGDRMNEGYRQHGSFVRPTLSRMPKEIMYRQVYASFQHDESAVAACAAMGFRNVMWGSDYPHMEGTFGHTQDTLHHLFDGVDPKVRERITVGAFTELFPGVPALPAPVAA